MQFVQMRRRPGRCRSYCDHFEPGYRDIVVLGLAILDILRCQAMPWHFEYSEDRLLQICGIINDEVMCAPDMWDLDGRLDLR